ncbi:MAG: FAD-binding oxidoreductase [Blastocatellia bacterium]|nr:FAD-binding oxidoreductase [Blastocatellia bacterium]
MQRKTNPDEIQGWLTDASNIAGGHATEVVFPTNAQEIAELLAAATRDRTPVTVAGAGTGITGGRVPFGGGVIAMDRFNAIRRIDDDCALVEAGVLLADLQSAVAARRLFYPPDPTEWSCQLGGTVATNASGARTFKYGTTRDYVRRLQIVLPTGDLLELRRGEIFADAGGVLHLPLVNGRGIAAQLPTYQMPRTRKHAAGYFNAPRMDAIDLFIGSEGTLGVITEIELGLLPQPADVLAGIVFFADQDDLLALVAAARELSFQTRRAHSSGLDARAIEYFDAEALAFLRPHHPRVPADAAGAIFFEQEITEATEGELMQIWLDLLERHHAQLDQSWFAVNETDRRQLRDFRHHLPVLVNEWIVRHGQRKISTDMAVGDEAFPAMLAFYQETLRDAHLSYVIFGHIGDNHVHVNILPRNDDEAARARAIYTTFIQRAIAVGGTISAEHGLGKLKRQYLEMLYGDAHLLEMAQLKRAFDPAGILGRGTLFEDRPPGE